MKANLQPIHHEALKAVINFERAEAGFSNCRVVVRADRSVRAPTPYHNAMNNFCLSRRDTVCCQGKKNEEQPVIVMAGGGTLIGDRTELLMWVCSGHGVNEANGATGRRATQ